MASDNVAANAILTPLARQDCTYTACYCEENVYLLLKHLTEERHKPAERLFAVFISNPYETVPLWQQGTSNQADGLVIWDYHVIVLEVPSASEALVWDLDTLLPFPCGFAQYAQQALKVDDVVLPEQYHRWCRVVPCKIFLPAFASNRSHMRKPDGTWLATPPRYSCIQAAGGCTNNLHCYRNMTSDVHNNHGSHRIGHALVPMEAQATEALPLAQRDGSAGSHSIYMHTVKPAAQNGRADSSYSSGAGASMPSWDEIVAVASNLQYGVVISEELLLSCLMQLHASRTHQLA